MNLSLMHPRDLITLIMKRLYGYGMTTTSGGNLSIMDSDGNMWISPGGIDKGTLRPEDIVCVQKDGTIKGIHKPSRRFCPEQQTPWFSSRMQFMPLSNSAEILLPNASLPGISYSANPILPQMLAAFVSSAVFGIFFAMLKATRAAG